MNVSACLVTRGDVDLQPVIDSLPPAWEIVIWDNGERMVTRSDGFAEVCPDLSVYGRYAAIEYATHDVILTQDDDVIISDPQAITTEWNYEMSRVRTGPPWNGIVANMPPEFRHAGYVDSCLVGFGSCFHRDLPRKAFERFAVGAWDVPVPEIHGEGIHYVWEYGDRVNSHPDDGGWFNRTCDVVFTTLTPRVLVDVPKADREMASDPNRMWKQAGHIEERERMLQLARKVRDA